MNENDRFRYFNGKPFVAGGLFDDGFQTKGDEYTKTEFFSTQSNLVCGRTKGLCNTPLDCFKGGKKCSEGFKTVPAGQNHMTGGDCWCKPKLDYIDNKTGTLVFVHQPSK